MRHKLISSRWKCIIIISSIFLTLNTVVFGGERKILLLELNIIQYIHFFSSCHK